MTQKYAGFHISVFMHIDIKNNETFTPSYMQYS